VELLQRRAGVGAQLLGQPLAELLVVPQRVGLAAAAVQGEHELAGQALVQRVRGGTGGQLAEQGGMLAAVQGEVVAVQPGGVPLRVQRVADAVQPGCVQRGERLAAPQPERLLEQGRGVLLVVGGVRPGDQVAEAVQVHRHRVDHEGVALRVPGEADPGVGEDLPEPGQVAGQRRAGPLRQPLGPHALDELVGRHHPVRVDQQRGQHAPLPGVAEVDGATVDTGLDAAEQPELDRHSALLRTVSPDDPGVVVPTSQFDDHRSVAETRRP